MYFERKWGFEVMGRKANRLSFGGGYTRRDGRKYLLFNLRMWVPYFPFRDLPWRFDDLQYIWIDLEEEDIAW